MIQPPSLSDALCTSETDPLIARAQDMAQDMAPDGHPGGHPDPAPVA